ncbi:MAG: glutaredoxin family protein [Planctomycetes bacterium]|nr:glutaredoxin family protein [Planctomycetota bacterium]
MVKEFLTKKGLAFEVKDVHTDASARDDMVEMGIMSIPVTRIDGGEPIVGADFARIEAALV